ncbi:unnamed protein product [Lupinus luteus]|uniref:Xyloglucan endotransglucosylase/hydrolase n=1 Tax=Lupinus luteus TaxID=3873 RepID=A0AAV1WCX9_LUPLU
MDHNFEITWGNSHAQMIKNNTDQVISLSLDKASGSSFGSKNQYLFGKVDMQLKLVHGNSAGTVTSYYLHSEGLTWDEIDFEFLGNVSGDPYVVHTNIYTQGKGNREQQFYLWFDPTTNFHNFSILWNPHCIIFFVDGIPIREFKNYESKTGVPFPSKQPMRVYGSIWDAEDWATKGGVVKTNWTEAPFTASFKNFNANACVWSYAASSCTSNSSSSSVGEWITQGLGAIGEEKMKLVQRNYMIYNYCTDMKRFPNGLPPECTISVTKESK